MTVGAPVNGRDFDLDPISGGLRGKITSTATGLPVPGITVSLYQRTGSGVFVTSAATDHRGNYFISSVPPGTYVAFTSNTLGYRNEIYNDIGCTGSCSVATAVASGAAIDVASTGILPGIDFALDLRSSPPAAPTNFRMVSNGGFTNMFAWNPPASTIAGPPVSYVIDAGFSPGGTAVSLPAGTGTTFSIPNIPTGTFYLRVRAVNAAGSKRGVVATTRP